MKNNRRRRPPVNPGPMPIITQKLLKEYKTLYGARYPAMEMRSRIIKLHEEGARVESGEYFMELDVVKHVFISWKRLAEVLGKKVANLVRRQIRPTEFYVLHVGRHGTTLMEPAWRDEDAMVSSDS